MHVAKETRDIQKGTLARVGMCFHSTPRSFPSGSSQLPYLFLLCQEVVSGKSFSVVLEQLIRNYATSGKSLERCQRRMWALPTPDVAHDLTSRITS